MAPPVPVSVPVKPAEFIARGLWRGVARWETGETKQERGVAPDPRHSYGVNTTRGEPHVTPRFVAKKGP